MHTDLHPFWTDPYDDIADISLRTEDTVEVEKENHDTTKASYIKFIKSIINQLIITHQLACKMEVNFQNAVFGLDTKSIPKNVKDFNYDWLPTEESLLALETQEDKIEDILPKIYTQLQTMSVGLEVIFENENHTQFNRLKTYIRSVLCEMYIAMKDCHLQLPPDVSRSVMPNEIRGMKGKAEIKIRNWIFFRNFIDISKCIIDVLKIFLVHITNIN
ncbi:uncharacterized protein LOC130896810 [Diorhabda carinulata]|uniref:uncharacterized protein LOC130896810 n=1 Tax=Diorhabda carinulata TaxID=1163345 RepID=UPI0025A2CA98|nr:uncharacterized protein LOC130896810 [Diorhabda carinulata]